MKNKKIAVFDWNGTLFDDTDLAVSCSNHVLAQFGLAPIDKATLQAHYDMPISLYYENLGMPRAVMEKDPQKIVDLYVTRYEAENQATPLMEGAKEILARLHAAGTHSLVLSNYLRDLIQTKIEQLQIAPFFADLLAYEGAQNQAHNVMARTGRVSKGDKLAAYIAAQKIDPRNVIVVGDTPEEMHIARDVGALSLAVATGYASVARLEAARPDHLVHHFRDMAPIFQMRGFF